MSRWMNRLMGAVLIMLLAGTPEFCAAISEGSPADPGDAPSSAVAQQTTTKADQRVEKAAQNMASAGENLPDSPGMLLAKQQEQGSPQVAPEPPQPQAAPALPAQQNAPSQQNNSQQESGASPSNSSQPQNTTQQPVGGAAAQLGRTTGGAASKPAGAALAPAKQGQTRSLLLKVGLIGGAAIAVGTVVALAHASPSRPPGTH